MIHNVHRVRLPNSAAAVGALLDTLGSAQDRVWPAERWPPMRLEGAPAPGVAASHGPVHYVVTVYEPGFKLGFRFTSPAGFQGGHRFLVLPDGDGAWFEHHVEIALRGWASLLWPLVFGPLHDALAEDAVARIVRELGGEPVVPRWSLWVRILRLWAR